MIFGWPFKKAPVVEPPQPVRGERWLFWPKTGYGPWPPAEKSVVKILDVRDGWVRYDMAVFRDERARVETFIGLYRRIDGPDVAD